MRGLFHERDGNAVEPNWGVGGGSYEGDGVLPFPAAGAVVWLLFLKP